MAGDGRGGSDVRRAPPGRGRVQGASAALRHARGGWLDLAIDLEGRCIGRIQTFVPSDRTLRPGVSEVGIGLHAAARGKGHGRDALGIFADWLFEHAGAVRVEAPTDPANAPMGAVFERVGWACVESYREFDREWAMYAITRERSDDLRTT